MSLLAIAFGRLGTGFALGICLFILRAAIDRNRGILGECLALVFLVLSAAACVAVYAESWLDFGQRLEPIIKSLFFALPLLVLVRLWERIRLGDAAKIADLFRFTTVISLAIFAFTTLESNVGIGSIATAVAVYCLAERGLRGTHNSYWFALASSIGFVAAIINAILTKQAVFTVFDPDWMWNDAWNLRSARNLTSLISFLFSLALAPGLIQHFYQSNRWLHRLAWWLAGLRYWVGNPRDLIHSRPILDLWYFQPQCCYLNHGSFGAAPTLIREKQALWLARQQGEPMDFLARKIEPAWFKARFELATWLGTKEDNIAFCENATAGMNEIAAWFPLEQGDEVLVNDHEYGAVKRIWQRRCDEAGATLKEIKLPLEKAFASNDHNLLCQAILDGCTSKTKLVIISHITSPTAVILPVQQICSQLRELGIASCIDGPHALLQESFRLHQLDCDFYVASCHKWLCAPIGSGFVYVAPKWHELVQPARLSWGRVMPTRPSQWTEELLWTGTRDHSPYLCVPDAINFFSQLGPGIPEKLDQRNHELACYARKRLAELPGAEPVTPEGREWFGWMVGVWLPPGDYPELQKKLWDDFRIEVPIINFDGRYLIRVSCHMYVTTHDVDFLLQNLRRLGVG